MRRVAGLPFRPRMSFHHYLPFGLVAVSVTVAAVVACSDPDSGAAADASSGGASTVPERCVSGTESPCAIALGTNGDVLSCYDGTRLCESGSWGPCVDGTVTSYSASDLAEQTRLRPQSLTDEVDCEANPCDPKCRIFVEQPDAAIVTQQGDPIFVWTSGDLDDYPPGLVNKGLVTPCSSGYDCQFNQACVEPITHPECSHSKCEPGAGLRPDCEDGYARQNAPSCVAMICEAMPQCCSAGRVETCEHAPCQAGPALKTTCDPCVDAVCAVSPECCGDEAASKKEPIVIEAESPTSSSGSVGGNVWQLVNDDDASGGLAMQARPDVGNTRNADYETKAPRLDFTADFDKTGKWYVWVRGRAAGSTTGTSDSCHVGLDGDGQSSGERISEFESEFTWSTARMNVNQPASIDVDTTGVHTVNLWMREDGFVVDKIVLTREHNYQPSGLGPVATGTIGVWSEDCVALYRDECETDCSEGTWTDACVAAVGSICDAECGERPVASCEHNVCDTGAALDARCHPCVERVCATDPMCCISEWDTACVNQVAALCDATCPVEMLLRPPESGRCMPRLPGETDPSCDGPDLAVGVPCDDVLPICNHGTETVPSGLTILHFPGNSQQYPSTNPDRSHPQMVECETTEAIAPGHCIGVADCEGLNGNREIMVNPEGSGIDECSRLDNWSLYSSSASSECQVPVCSTSDTTAQFTDSTLYFIMDKSGSMNDDAKWTKSVDALEKFFASEDAAGLGVALEFYPLDPGSTNGDGCGSGSRGQCDGGPCSNPMVPAAFLTSATGASDDQESALVAALESVTPGGKTPTYPALDGTLDRAIADQRSNPGDLHTVILVTDGEPNGCEESTHELAKLALAAWLEHGIRTYTIGMEGANTDALDIIATAGGTRQAFVVRSGEHVEQDLLTALLAIARSSARCEFAVQNGEFIDPSQAELSYTPGDGSAPVLLPLLARADDCGEGWYYDDPTDPTSAALCPDTCDAVQSDLQAQVKMVIGCASPYEPTDFSERYVGTCPSAEALQWGFFTYDADLESGAEIRFEARTAGTEEELEEAEWVEVATATDELAKCGLGGPLPACPVNLYAALDGPPAAKAPYLELRAILEPNDSRTSQATLNSWELTYTCVDDE